MFLAGHVAAGALIGQQLGTNPVLIFLLAFASHFLLDLVPHGDHHHVDGYYNGHKEAIRKLYNAIIVDAVITIIMVIILLVYTDLNKVAIAWGMIGGVLPDLLVGIAELRKSKLLNLYNKFHFWFHDALVHSFKVRPWPGALGQIIVIGAFLVAL